MQVVSKIEFAQIAGLTPGRVSQLVSQGKIPPEAMVGEGRSAKIVVDVARDALRQRLNPMVSAGKRPTTAASDNIDVRLKEAALEQRERQNRKLAEDEALRRGQLMLAGDARVSMTRAAQTILLKFEGGLPNIANAIAEKFGVPPRDALHLLQQEFLALRTRTAESLKAQALAEPALIDTDMPD